MDTEKQLKEWVKGNSMHMEDQCCPDFSCCGVEMADKRTREVFYKAHTEGDDATTMQMLGMFLGNALAGAEDANKEVYIAGVDSGLTNN